MITIACCIPRQEVTIEAKVKWLRDTLDKTPCDLFLLPQEFIGGHYVHHNLSKGQMPLHVPRSQVEEIFGEIAGKHGVALGVGACITDEDDPDRGTEDYLYFNKDGSVAGHHRKFALPRYDDARAKGAGRLWPETVWKDRATPIELPSLGLRIGTVFCWEIFALTLAPAYAFAKTNLIVHPIKFAPRGWLKTQVIDGEQHIVGFNQAPKSQEWIARLKMLGRHEVLCPIAISCNTWSIGDKYKAITGHVDEMLGTTDIVERGSEQETEHIHSFTMNPKYYLLGTDNTFSPGAFKEATGSLDGLKELAPLTMHLKMRRIESYLLNDITRLECLMKAQALRTKPSVHKRAAARGLVEAT
jgi:predicted amidohydrolase